MTGFWPLALGIPDCGLASLSNRCKQSSDVIAGSRAQANTAAQVLLRYEPHEYWRKYLLAAKPFKLVCANSLCLVILSRLRSVVESKDHPNVGSSDPTSGSSSQQTLLKVLERTGENEGGARVLVRMP
jgi:hypothetical protein